MRPVLPRDFVLPFVPFATCFALIALACVPDSAAAQVFAPQPAPVYGPPVYAQPAYAPPVYAPQQPETYGNLVGRAAFFGRLSLGTGADFFRRSYDDSEDSESILSGVALHTDFSLGVRFGFIHALSVDFDFDRGFNPSVDGTEIANGTSYAGSFGASYTNFLTGTGLFIGAGLGLGIAWVEVSDYESGGDWSSPTAVGLAAHARIGYDWTLGRRTHLGLVGTLRYYGMTDEVDARWRGVGVTAAASFAWY